MTPRPGHVPSRRISARALGLIGVLVAVVLTVLGIPVTAAQGTTLFVARADGALPVDAPFDPAWDGARMATITLTGQLVTPPMLDLAAFPSIRARAIEDGRDIAVLLEWDDPTLDESSVAVEQFADAAAVQFALGLGTSICMGQQAGGLNIWHWKADWAAAIAGRGSLEAAHPGMPTDVHAPVPEGDPALTEDGFLTGQMAGNPRSAPTFTSSVEDLSAVGFGTLTAQPAESQSVHGASEHRGGIWRVVMSRSLDSGDPNDVALDRAGPPAVVAFAVWDGARGDRDGLKSVSTWLSLAFEPEPIGLLDMWPFLFLLLLALTLSGLVMAYGARQPAVGLGWGPKGPPGTRGDDGMANP